ncbi:MAG: site-specific integrase [Pseudolabrys sp.]
MGVILGYGHRLDMIEGRPKLPYVHVVETERAAVTPAQETRIVRYLEEHGRPEVAFCVRVLAATGMRRGELLALRADQIETPEQIEHTGWKLTKEQTKTNAARWVPFPPASTRKLRALIASGGMPNAAQLSDTFRRAVKALGEMDGVTLHGLRHATASRLGDAGVDALIISKLLGHSSGLMTERYVKPSEEYLFQVAQKVHKGLGEIAKSAEVMTFQPIEKSA